MNEDREENLRGLIDALSDVSSEAPPNVAELQMLAVRVLREQRRQTWRALASFWAVAVLLLSAVLYSTAHWPVFFIVLQGCATLALIPALLLGSGRRKQVSE
ncbi:MAG: YxlC family protein [Mycobacterium leprae]